MEKNILSLKLKEYRQKNNLKQAELAEILDVSDKTISKWELGETYPSKSNMIKIEEKLGIGIELLLLEENGVKMKSQKMNYMVTIGVLICIVFGLFVQGGIGFGMISISAIAAFLYLIIKVMTIYINKNK